MFRYALRRLLWCVPTLLGTSLVLFFVTTLAPAPRAFDSTDPAAGGSAPEQSRRARFLDLPPFVNTHPRDVRVRALEALARVARGAADAERGAGELVRLGGAALPYVLPAFEALPADARRQVAVALQPLADRMGIAATVETASGPEAVGAPSMPSHDSQAERAALLWTRFWDDRALEFQRTGIDRAVVRLVEHGSELRERDLIVLDTFALRALIRAMDANTSSVALARLTRLAHHAAGRGPVLEADADPDQVRRALADWHEWWFVYSTDFAPVEGVRRVIAVVTDTRYGRWLRRIVSGELGITADGEPVGEKLRTRAPLTLLVCGLALLASTAIAVPLGALAAWRRGHLFDRVSSAIMFLLYATPTFALAELLRRAAGPRTAEGWRLTLAVVAVAAGSTAILSRWQRAEMLEVMGKDFVRTAHAKGVPGWRILVFHALRNALLPVVTIASLQLPALLAGAFVVEEVFRLPGIGFETMRAIESHDSAWLMTILLATATVVTIGLVAADIAYGALDPRMRDVLARREGGPRP